MMAIIFFGARPIKGVHRATNRKTALLRIVFLSCFSYAQCAAAAHDLVSARLEPCPDCRTADDLLARIRSAIPGLDRMSQIDRIEALMHWSASVSDHSRDASFIPSDFEQWDESDALFDFFDRNIGGVSCGGMAVFFRRVLHFLGIDAFAINYGVPDSRVTHVSVVVPFGDDFLLLDPTFAIIYRPNGSPLSITDGLGLIRAGKAHLIETRMNGAIERDAIVPADWFRQGPGAKASVATEEHLSCRLRLSVLYARFASALGAAWAGAGAPLTHLPLLRLMLQGVFHVGPGYARSRVGASSRSYAKPGSDSTIRLISPAGPHAAPGVHSMCASGAWCTGGRYFPSTRRDEPPIPFAIRATRSIARARRSRSSASRGENPS